MSEQTNEIGAGVLDLQKTHGILLESSGSTETHVSGHISTNRREGTSGSIGTTTVERQEIWLRLEDGGEICFKWKGYQVPMRKGHKITVISALVDDFLYAVAIVNHTINEYRLTRSNPDWVLKLIGASSAGVGWGVGLIGCVAVAMLTTMAFGSDPSDQGVAFGIGLFLGAPVGGIVGLIAGASTRTKRRNTLGEILDNHCQQEMQKGFPTEPFESGSD